MLSESRGLRKRDRSGRFTPAVSVSQTNWAILSFVVLALLVLSPLPFLSGQLKPAGSVTAKASNDWLKTLLAKGSKDIPVSPAHPEMRLHIYEDFDTASPHYGVKLCWLLLPHSSIRMAVADVRTSAESNSIYAALAQNSDVVVSNGGFFGYGPKSSYLPVGLVIANGKASSPQAKWSSGGAIIQANGTPTIVPQSALNSLHAVQEAVQSKPMLVEGGQPGIQSDSKPAFNRVSVGVDKNGDVIVAGAFQGDGSAVNLVELSAFLAAPRKMGGPEAFYALNLDGGPDAHLFFPAIRLHLGYGGQNFVPNAIRFYWK